MYTQPRICPRECDALTPLGFWDKTDHLILARQPEQEEPSLPYYLPITGGRIFGFIPFPRVLVLCEMQSVSTRIWTRVTVSISYDDNHYTTGTSKAKIDNT